MLYYVVISPPLEMFEELKNVFTPLFKKYLLVIEEKGKNGDHPHLNIILDKDTGRTDAVSRSFKLKIKNKLNYESRNLIRAKQVHDLTFLIGGYLQKEEGFKVLSNNGNYDMVHMKKEASEKGYFNVSIKPAFEWCQTPTTLNIVPIIIAHCNMNNEPIPLDMIRLNVIFAQLTKKKICIIHLLRKRFEILEVLNMYVQ